MDLSLTQSALGLASGSLVGFTLGLVGGGGSILAVPLLVYLVGVTNPHVAIGTSAVAVAVECRRPTSPTTPAPRNVKWRCALVFAVAGVIGAFGGSTLGKMVDGQKLLALFAVLMMIVGALMLRKRSGEGDAIGQARPGQLPEARRHRPGDRAPCPASSASAAAS